MQNTRTHSHAHTQAYLVWYLLMRLMDANLASLVSSEYYYAASSASNSSGVQCQLYLDPIACYQQLRSASTTTPVPWDAYQSTGTRSQSMSWEAVLAVMRVAGVFLFPFFALSTAAVRLEGVHCA